MTTHVFIYIPVLQLGSLDSHLIYLGPVSSTWQQQSTYRAVVSSVKTRRGLVQYGMQVTVAIASIINTSYSHIGNDDRE